MSIKCILVSSLIGFAIIGLGLVIGYFLDPRPLSSYEDMALFAFFDQAVVHDSMCRLSWLSLLWSYWRNCFTSSWQS